MPVSLLNIATRKSPLALWQANHVRDLLLQHWPALNIELLPMQTSGDKFYKAKLLAIGGKALFVKELEEALLDKRAALAVHSMKDMPAALPTGLSITTICHRQNPLDALISFKYESLLAIPKGATVGTSSLRRQSQLLALRPDLKIKPLRGNIQTRLGKMQSGDYDAIVLAAAGLERMNLSHLITELLSEQDMLPACGQGALGIECRQDDEPLQTLLAPLNDPLSALCVNTERQVNALLGGHCHTPVAIYCKPTGQGNLLLCAKVCSPDGNVILSHQQHGTETEASMLAKQCADMLLKEGADQLMKMKA